MKTRLSIIVSKGDQILQAMLNVEAGRVGIVLNGLPLVIPGLGSARDRRG
jgi:hypothetical protein